MSGGEFAAIEAACREAIAQNRSSGVGEFTILSLVAAVRERDNTIARVRARIDSAEQIAEALDFPRVVLIDTLRAALDPQETE